MQQTSEHVARLIRVVATATVLVWILTLLARKVIDSDEVFGALSTFGVVGLTVSVLLVLLQSPLWRHPPLRWIYRGVPDLSGRWEGWYLSEYDNKPRMTAHEVQQTGLVLRVDAYGPDDAKCLGKTATILSEGPRGPFRLIWAYYMEGQGGPDHAGVHVLHYSQPEGRLLEGFYINNRVRTGGDGTQGRAGQTRLTYAGKRLKNCLGSHGQWAMPNPWAQNTPPSQTEAKAGDLPAGLHGLASG